MRYAALVLILFAGAVNAETFKCQAGPFWASGGKIVVVAAVNEDGETGTITVAGITHQTIYTVEGFNRSWHFGGTTKAGLYKYSFTLQPDGIAHYYDFTGAAAGETVSSEQTYRCN